jgi:hypothetical protein
VTIAEPESDVFAEETAVTVTVAGFGMEVGAVYNPLALMVPAVVLPPGVPFTCQVTAVFVVPVTVARNCTVAAGLTVVEEGVTVTAIDEGGGLLPPQEPRSRETARLGMSQTVGRMRSLTRGRSSLR